MTDTALFGADLHVPALHSITGGDTPRARATDKLTSHQAADRSSVNVKAVKRELLVIIGRRGSLTGSEANTLYRDAAIRSDGALPVVAWDSPRKRLGELAADRLLIALNEDHPRGTETVYALPTDELKVSA